MIRLPAVERGRGARSRLLPLLFGRPAPGFVKVLLYRHDFFGGPVGRYGQAVLRGASRWDLGERELFGGVVSVGNQCGYCAGLHCEIAGRRLGATVVADVLRGGGSGGGDPRLAAMVPFLRRLSRQPDQLDTGDVATLRAAGLDERDILDAVHAAVLLEICNRVVNTLGVAPMPPRQRGRSAAFLLRRGYDL